MFGLGRLGKLGSVGRALAFSAVRDQAISGRSTGTQNDTASGYAVDSTGNIFICGANMTTTRYAFLAKFDASMTLLWQRKQSMTAKFQTLDACGIDSSDNVYMLCNGYVTASPELPHLFKYNNSGTLQWQRKLTAADTTNAAALVVNTSGDCFLGLQVTATTQYAIIAKYNSSGTIQWQRKLSSTYYCAITALAQAHDGGVIGVGMFYDGANNAANARGTVFKYDASGAIQWQFKIHWSAAGQWSGVAVDSVTGDIYLGGQYTVTATSAGAITKLNSAGTHQWTRRHPTTSTGLGVAMAVDPVTGYVYFYANLTATLCCMDASGNIVWERVLKGDSASNAALYGLVVTATELVALGNFVHTGAGDDAVALRMPLTGGGATSCDYIDITIPSATAYTTPAAPTNVAAGLTDAAGASTDAAGTATDAAGAFTFTNYTN